MTRPSPSSPSRASRWILVLAGLGVATALIVMWVVSRDASRRGERTKPSPSRSRATRGPERATARGEGRRHIGRRGRRAHTGRVDRRRVAEALGLDRHGRRRGPGGGPVGERPPGPGGGEEPDLELDPVFPVNVKGIRGAIRARISEVKECYDGWLAFDDTLAGKLVVAFTIEQDPEGDLARISNAELQSSTLKHAGLERCVLVMMESLRFEAPESGPVTVKYPFRFRTGKEDKPSD